MSCFCFDSDHFAQLNVRLRVLSLSIVNVSPALTRSTPPPSICQHSFFTLRTTSNRQRERERKRGLFWRLPSDFSIFCYGLYQKSNALFWISQLNIIWLQLKWLNAFVCIYLLKFACCKYLMLNLQSLCFLIFNAILELYW